MYLESKILPGILVVSIQNILKDSSSKNDILEFALYLQNVNISYDKLRLIFLKG